MKNTKHCWPWLDGFLLSGISDGFTGVATVENPAVPSSDNLPMPAGKSNVSKSHKSVIASTEPTRLNHKKLLCLVHATGHGRNQSSSPNRRKGIARNIFKVFAEPARSDDPFVAKTIMIPRGVIVNSSAEGVDGLTKKHGMRISWTGLAALNHQYPQTGIPVHPCVV